MLFDLFIVNIQLCAVDIFREAKSCHFHDPQCYPLLQDVCHQATLFLLHFTSTLVSLYVLPVCF